MYISKLHFGDKGAKERAVYENERRWDTLAGANVTLRR